MELAEGALGWGWQLWSAAAGASLLLILSALTARPPGRPPAPLERYFERWSTTHGGYDPRSGSVWVRGWLSMIHRIARPVARTGVHPDVLTLWTIWLAYVVVVAAAAGGRWPLLAGWLVLLGGIGDSLDGAVAVLTDRATRWGYVLDSVADRVTDTAYVVALVVLGAPASLGAVCVFTFFLLEYMRARGGNAGAGEIGAVTVGERANRVAFCAVGLAFAGVLPARAGPVVTTSLVVLTVLSVVGLGQLTVAVRRRLASPPH